MLKITPRHLLLGLHNQTDYIPKDIQDVSKIGFIKKKQAKKAILWLLSIAPHSIKEIADHFDISSALVKGLLMELTKANLVVNVPGNNHYFKSKKSDSEKKTYEEEQG